jgi:outer membrane protein OmpA-like peptidoglycan-associated protein
VRQRYGRRRPVRLIAAVVALVLGAAVMVMAARGAWSPRRAVTTADEAASIPAIGILVATSPADHDLHQAGTWTASAEMVAAAAGQSGAHVVLDRIGAGPKSSDVMYDARVANGNGQNALTRSTQLKHAQINLVQAFGNEQASTTPGPVDVISGVRFMEQHLSAFPHARTTNVVIFGNVLQTAAPIDLADPVQLADPVATLQTVVSQGLLTRDSCTGWRVSMVDGSLTPGGGLSALQDEQLREFWREFFAWCGGRLVLWDSTLIAFPANGQVAPASWMTVHGHRQILVQLLASVLFEPDQAVLLPGAGPTLSELARKLLYTYPTATADIAGYTAAVGGGNGVALSQARAKIIADWLEASGVSASRLTVHGYGDHDQIASDATAAGQALNRRVVVTLHVG